MAALPATGLVGGTGLVTSSVRLFSPANCQVTTWLAVIAGVTESVTVTVTGSLLTVYVTLNVSSPLVSGVPAGITPATTGPLMDRLPGTSAPGVVTLMLFVTLVSRLLLASSAVSVKVAV